MFGMIFNTTNLLILIVIVFISYAFWKPFIRGKKIRAVVDGYCHPQTGKHKDEVWCYRFMYRESKAGKRLYCYSRMDFDTKEEMRANYPKGAEVDIRYYKDANEADTMAVIVSDKAELKRTILYTLLAFLGGTGMAVGYQLLLMQM